jgi:Branched-chain amino acid transport system / permease component
MQGFLHRRLRELGARAGDDLPGNSPRQFRAGRNGDVLNLHRLGDDRCRLSLLGGFRPHPRFFVRCRCRHRTDHHPAGGTRAGAEYRDGFIGPPLILNRLAGWISSCTINSFPSPFQSGAWDGSKYMSSHEVGMIAVTLAVLILVFLFFRLTPLGLAMRAAAWNPVSSRLVGIRVGRMSAFGCGFAIGAVAGMMARRSSISTPI